MSQKWLRKRGTNELIPWDDAKFEDRQHYEKVSVTNIIDGELIASARVPETSGPATTVVVAAASSEADTVDTTTGADATERVFLGVTNEIGIGGAPAEPDEPTPPPAPPAILSKTALKRKNKLALAEYARGYGLTFDQKAMSRAAMAIALTAAQAAAQAGD